MKIYLVGPITGAGYATIKNALTEKKIILENAGYTVLSPMAGKAHLRTEIEFKPHGYTQPASQDHAIFERDLWMVQQSDIILADFRDFSETGRVSIGSMFELAWACQLNKKVVTILPEGNIHKHVFVLEASDIIFPRAVEALSYLVDFAEETFK